MKIRVSVQILYLPKCDKTHFLVKILIVQIEKSIGLKAQFKIFLTGVLPLDRSLLTYMRVLEKVDFPTTYRHFGPTDSG